MFEYCMQSWLAWWNEAMMNSTSAWVFSCRSCMKSNDLHESNDGMHYASYILLLMAFIVVSTPHLALWELLDMLLVEVWSYRRNQ